jgi:hypothetical protein
MLLLSSLAAAPVLAQAQPSRLPLHEGVAQAGEDYVIIPGAVENRSGGWIRSVRVDIVLLDASGREILRDRVYTSRERIPPGEIGVFKYTRDTRKIQGHYASHKLEASAIPTSADADAQTGEVSVTRSGSYTEARGILRGAGATPCHAAAAVGAAYDAAGRLLDVSTIVPDVPRPGLAQGATAAFKLLFRDPQGHKIANVKVWGSCGN